MVLFCTTMVVFLPAGDGVSEAAVLLLLVPFLRGCPAWLLLAFLIGDLSWELRQVVHSVKCNNIG